MSLISVAKTIEPFAETLAAAFGTPIAGAAVHMIGEALGCDKTPEAVEQAISKASPDDLLKLKQADADFKSKMAALGVNLEEIAAADRESAREREVRTGDSVTPRVLSAIIIVGYFVVQYYIMTNDIVMKDLVMRSLGTLDMALGLVLSYYFGSSSGSSDKNKILENLSK